jgi:hypothetical protein
MKKLVSNYKITICLINKVYKKKDTSVPLNITKCLAKQVLIMTGIVNLVPGINLRPEEERHSFFKTVLCSVLISSLDCDFQSTILKDGHGEHMSKTVPLPCRVERNTR